MNQQQDSLIQYPCHFPIKVMGSTHPDFTSAIVHVVREFDPAFDETQIETRASSGGRYTGLTVTVLVTNREQLDNIYRALTSHPMVKMVL